MSLARGRRLLPGFIPVDHAPARRGRRRGRTRHGCATAALARWRCCHATLLASGAASALAPVTTLTVPGRISPGDGPGWGSRSSPHAGGRKATQPSPPRTTERAHARARVPGARASVICTHLPTLVETGPSPHAQRTYQRWYAPGLTCQPRVACPMCVPCCTTDGERFEQAAFVSAPRGLRRPL